LYREKNNELKEESISKVEKEENEEEENFLP